MIGEYDFAISALQGKEYLIGGQTQSFSSPIPGKSHANPLTGH